MYRNYSSVCGMQITLSPKTEEFIESEIASGHVTSAADLIDEAMEQYQLSQKHMDAHLLEGLNDANTGRLRSYSSQMLEDIKQKSVKENST
jgi:predicted transcriptional regulator